MPPEVQGTTVWRAHPRSRGANHGVDSGEERPPGSSPLARGEFDLGSWRRLRHWLIPARAGRIGPGSDSERRDAAHPRSRGANLGPRGGSPPIRGSSPLARGEFHAPETTLEHPRLIPARAGRIARSLRRLATRSGSSPLARGESTFHLATSMVFRLIPARAGRITDTRSPSLISTAHPRSRGANHWCREYVEDWEGSSPLARAP